MFYNESIHITDWFYLRFIENPGMAFGMQIVPKAIQTIARTIFAIAIGWYIVILIKAKYKRGYIACISLDTGRSYREYHLTAYSMALFSARVHPLKFLLSYL